MKSLILCFLLFGAFAADASIEKNMSIKAVKIKIADEPTDLSAWTACQKHFKKSARTLGSTPLHDVEVVTLDPEQKSLTALCVSRL